MKNLNNTLTVLWLSLMLLATSTACAQPEAATAPPLKTLNTVRTTDGRQIKATDLDAFLAQTMEENTVPGLSFALINNQKIVYHRSFGVTNTETSEMVNNQTIFEAASLSKPIFAYFVLKLAEQGKIELDKPLYQYLPHPGIDSAYQQAYKTITARIVLKQSSGFPNWSHGEQIKLSHTPGQGHSYSGEAYQYLAAAIGIHLGVGFESGLDSVFQQLVAEPLGLKNTYFTWNDYIAQHKAFGHQAGQVTDKMDHGPSFGAGYSLHTEAQDYARFLIELMQGNNLSEAYLQLILSEQSKFSADNPLLETGQTGWSLGMARRPTENGIRYLHTGNNHDFMAYCQIYPESGHGLVLFMNCDTLEPFYTALGTYLNDEF